MTYESFKENLSPEEINMLDDTLNIPYEHPARTDFLHLSRVLYHLYKQHVYDDPDIDEAVINALMDLADVLFLEESSDYLSSEGTYSSEDEPDWDEDGILIPSEDGDEDDSQLELDWDDYDLEDDLESEES